MDDEMRKFFAGIVLPQLIAKSTMEELLDPATVSRIRSGVYQVTAEIILTIHKQTGLSVEEIESLIKENQ